MMKKTEIETLDKTVAANRRKRMLSNNKKKIIWRKLQAFMQMIAE
ncbi:hypothetical protein OK016_13130 [Vibrio chagasii]|nr:hypothetical protein [Vibrio chagasii]